MCGIIEPFATVPCAGFKWSAEFFVSYWQIKNRTVGTTSHQLQGHLQSGLDESAAVMESENDNNNFYKHLNTGIERLLLGFVTIYSLSCFWLIKSTGHCVSTLCLASTKS